MSLDATNGFYQAIVTVEEIVGDGETTELKLRFSNVPAGLGGS